jgi:hypothetical protein
MALPVVFRTVSPSGKNVNGFIRDAVVKILGDDCLPEELPLDASESEVISRARAGIYLVYFLTPLDKAAAWEAGTILGLLQTGRGSSNFRCYSFAQKPEVFKGAGVTPVTSVIFDIMSFISLLKEIKGEGLSREENKRANDSWSHLTDSISSALVDDMIELTALMLTTRVKGAQPKSAAENNLGAAVERFVHSLETPKLGNFMDKISTAYHQIVRSPSESEDSQFGEVFLDGAHKAFDLATRDLDRLAHYEFIPFDQQRAHEFYYEVIMPNVTTSMWTTNLAQFGGNFGRRRDPELLRAQGEAVRDGVQMTRVFVYHKKDEGLAKLRELMRQQVEQGVMVRVIEEHDFNERAHLAKEKFDTMDFMILDDKYLYLTIMDATGNGIARTKFKYDLEWLGIARQLKTEIEECSRLLRSEDIADFSND